VILQAALNGSRRRGDHPALPITAAELAADAFACVRAGASEIHFHPRAADGAEALDADVVDAAVRAVSSVVAVPVGVTTGAWIAPDPDARAALVRNWREPRMASVNLSEPGAELVMRALSENGIGIEAGVWSVEDSERLSAVGLPHPAMRVLVEIVHPVADPIAEVLRIDTALDELGISAPRLYHGEDNATWPILGHALSRRLDTRIGLEDTLRLPDGEVVESNSSLVATVCEPVNREARVR